MTIVNKYIEALAAEQQEMISYVKRMTANVSFPESAVVTTQPIQPKNHSWVRGVWARVIGSKNASNTSVQREVDYFKVTSHYYKSLSDIYKYVTNHWTETLTELKGKLKSDIMQVNMPEEMQNKAIQSILTTSVVDMSMSALSKDLHGIEMSKNENGYNQYVSVFERKCIEAINTAFDEQRAVYGKLREVITE